ncbi:MAG: hypothetical protein AB1586_20120 [Pseudomonadota bacterium]
MPTSILGQCDMVLALSQDTINYQFAQLWQRHVIRNDWKVLVRSQTGSDTVKTQEDSDFDAVLSLWLQTQSHLAELYAAGKYEEFGKALAEAIKNGWLWNYGWTSNIDAPAITILQSTRTSLLFVIQFSSGFLYSNSDPTKGISSYDLTKSVYAFDVPIGRIEIGKHEILTAEAQNQADQVIRETGLTDSDFTIEALFLDFENANIANFDAPASRFPQGATTALQVAVQDYFKLIVVKQKNPYILGYAIKVKTITSQKALFQPTAARFSTSYSDRQSARAFNFLLMGGNRGFPPGQNVGILPASLLEHADSGVDGVFAIDYGIFEAALIEPFIKALQAAVTKGFRSSGYTRSGQHWSLSAQSSNSKSVDLPPSDLLHDTDMDSDMSVNSMLDLKNSGTALVLGGAIEYALTIEIRPWVLFKGGRTTAYRARLSTSGQYKEGPSGKKGQPGYVEIAIAPGTEGKVNFTITRSDAPALGYGSKPDEHEGGGGIWGVIQSDWNSFSKEDAEVAAIDATQRIAAIINDVKSRLQDTINSLSVGKVILPLGQIYAFKHVLMATTDSTDDNAVLFNINYAPVVH